MKTKLSAFALMTAFAANSFATDAENIKKGIDTKSTICAENPMDYDFWRGGKIPGMRWHFKFKEQIEAGCFPCDRLPGTVDDTGLHLVPSDRGLSKVEYTGALIWWAHLCRNDHKQKDYKHTVWQNSDCELKRGLKEDPRHLRANTKNLGFEEKDLTDCVPSKRG